MNTRSNGSSFLPNESGIDIAAQQQTINYLRDFNAQASHSRNLMTESNMVLLYRSTSLLSTTTQAHHFNNAYLEVSTFFINLHHIMSSASGVPIDSDVFWSCIGLLEHCSQNLETRRAIIEDYHFVPLLTFVLKNTQAPDKVHRLLVLMQNLTYGISITWEEPYIIVLLQLLVEMVNNGVESDEDESHALLALSVLINLIYKNFVVHFLFLRSVDMSSFSKKIRNYGMLANKMLIVLSEDMYTPDDKEMKKFLRSTFASIDDCVKLWNVPHLRHIVDFLIDSKSHSRLHAAMLHYGYYCEDLERLLDKMEARASCGNTNEESPQQALCMGMLFQLICYILELSVIPEDDGTENIISLDSLVPRIFKQLNHWIHSDVSGVDAVKLLDRLVRLGKKETITPNIARDPSIIVRLIATTEKQGTSPQHSTAIIQLLLSLLHQAKTDKLILSKTTESFFDKILAPLLSSRPELSGNTGISLPDLEKAIFCLLLLINFAGVAKKAYFEKCEKLLQLPQIQNALARALLNGSEEVCSAIFQISQFEHFPQAHVAKYISELNASVNQVNNKASKPVTENWCDVNAILRSHKTFLNKEIEARLHGLIESISLAQRNNQLNNVSTAQIIELFNYKIDKFTCAESSMQKRLDDASSEITNLTQRISLQNAEIEKYHSMNFELHVNNERTQTKCKDLQLQKDNLRRNNETQMKKLSEQSDLLQTSERRLSVKVADMIVLQTECNAIKEQLRTKTEEFEKLKSSYKENVTRIEALKKNIAAYEADIKERTRVIAEKERDLIKLQKALDEQKEANKKADGVIAVIEAQLVEKNEQIRNLELEQHETEELRTTILSLIESKKGKKKF